MGPDSMWWVRTLRDQLASLERGAGQGAVSVTVQMRPAMAMAVGEGLRNARPGLEVNVVEGDGQPHILLARFRRREER